MEEATDGAKSNVGWLEETMDLLHKMASEQRQGETPLERTLNTEAFFLVYTALNRFRRLISEGWLDLERATLFKLVRQAVAPLSVPFHGEPAAGLQIMGVLETRCLDFKNVIMLSVSEGFLPGTMKDNSFIPYNLRLEFGLTTTRHKVAVYAYYFTDSSSGRKNLPRLQRLSFSGRCWRDVAVHDATAGGVTIGRYPSFHELQSPKQADISTTYCQACSMGRGHAQVFPFCH